MSIVKLKIDGMKCSGCSQRLEKILNNKENIKSAKVDLEKKEAVIDYANITTKDIEKYIEEIGFKSLGEVHENSNFKD